MVTRTNSPTVTCVQFIILQWTTNFTHFAHQFTAVV